MGLVVRSCERCEEKNWAAVVTDSARLERGDFRADLLTAETELGTEFQTRGTAQEAFDRFDGPVKLMLPSRQLLRGRLRSVRTGFRRFLSLFRQTLSGNTRIRRRPASEHERKGRANVHSVPWSGVDCDLPAGEPARPAVAVGAYTNAGTDATRKEAFAAGRS